MKVLSRSTQRPMTHRSRSKVLLLRQPVKSVRASEHPDPLPVRLAIGVVGAAGGLLILWLLGVLGYRLGYAPLVRVPELTGDAGGGLTTATLMLTRLPGVIIEAGLASPVALSIAFAMIAIPGAGLSAARPPEKGGPRPSVLARVFGVCGAILAGIQLILVIWWSASPLRSSMLQPLPDDPALGATWVTELQTVAGFDAMLMLVMGLWTVLSLRLPVALWMRSLAACAAIFGLVISIVVMSVSNAAVAQITTPHSVGIIEPGAGNRGLVLGSTREHIALLRVEEGVAVVQLAERPVGLNVVERHSVEEFLETHATLD